MYTLLIVLCILVIFSYLFDLIARRTRVPSVLMLLVLGCAMRYGSISLGFPLIDFSSLLPLLGTVGLILIVFEGALELKYEAGKGKLIRSAFSAAAFILVLTSFAIASVFHLTSGHEFYRCLLNAIPFSVISSAIAIPSAMSLFGKKREFIIYESSFSDILGIMLFNIILVNESVSGSTILHFGIETLLLLSTALVFCFGLLFVMSRMTHHVKFFLIISILILIYAVGKQFHLSSLILILMFGLFLENSELIFSKISHIKVLHKSQNMLYPDLRKDLAQLHQLSAESAFLLRTFFFLVFGYTMDLGTFDLDIVYIGMLVLACVYSIRLIYLRVVAHDHVWPEVLVSPRGLISVLLFLSIPVEKHVFTNSNGLLIFSILATSILMSLALVITGKRPTKDPTSSDD